MWRYVILGHNFPPYSKIYNSLLITKLHISLKFPAQASSYYVTLHSKEYPFSTPLFLQYCLSEWKIFHCSINKTVVILKNYSNMLVFLWDVLLSMEFFLSNCFSSSIGTQNIFNKIWNVFFCTKSFTLFKHMIY